MKPIKKKRAKKYRKLKNKRHATPAAVYIVVALPMKLIQVVLNR